MKKKVFVRTGCIIICAVFLTGCSGFHKLDNPYVFSERASLYESSVTGEKAETFAKDLCVVTADTPLTDESVTSQAAAVFDLADKTVVFAKNPFERLYPASTTKTMTALVALKAVASGAVSLSDEVTVPQEALITEPGASLCGIKPGDKLTLEELLYGLMLPSGNDAGVAIAMHVSDSVSGFADMMNEEALKIGATGTHFVNPHGLNDQNHYTTAYDLYLIFNEALKNPEFRKIISATEFKASYEDGAGNPVNITWKGSNWYMTGERQMPNGLTFIGGKTGTTLAAGSCLVMGSSAPSGQEYISVILKAENRQGLYDNMTNILYKIAE